MIKINYESCWKQFKEEVLANGIYTESELEKFEKDNTIELKMMAPEDIFDSLKEKYLENYTELIELKRKIRDLIGKE